MKDTWPIRGYSHSHLQASAPLMCTEGKQHEADVKGRSPPLQNVSDEGLVTRVHTLPSKLDSCFKWKVCVRFKLL